MYKDLNKNLPSRASKHISKLCRVAKTSLKILSDVRFKIILIEKTGMIEIKQDKKGDTKPDIGNGTSQDLQCETSEKQVSNITKSLNRVQSQEIGNVAALKEEDSE